MEQAERKHHVEAAEGGEARVLHVGNMEGDVGVMAPRFGDIFFPGVYRSDLEAHIM